MAHDHFYGICENKCLVEIKAENIPGCATTAIYDATISANSWSTSAPYTQTVTVSGIKSSDTPIIDVSLSSTTSTALNQLEAWSCVSKITTRTNGLTVTCFEDKPTTAIPIKIKVVR